VAHWPLTHEELAMIAYLIGGALLGAFFSKRPFPVVRTWVSRIAQIALLVLLGVMIGGMPRGGFVFGAIFFLAATSIMLFLYVMTRTMHKRYPGRISTTPASRLPFFGSLQVVPGRRRLRKPESIDLATARASSLLSVAIRGRFSRGKNSQWGK